VTNRLALHHYADARKALAEMARVLQTRRIVALTDNVVPPDKQTAGYINHFEKLRDPSHNWAYPLARLEAYFGDAKTAGRTHGRIQERYGIRSLADRMGASAETKANLRKLLLEAPEE